MMSRLQAITSTRSFNHWLWNGGIAFAGLLLLLLLGLLVFSGGSLMEEAMQSGQRIVINLNSGKVEGKQIILPPKEGEVAKPAAAIAPAALPPANPEIATPAAPVPAPVAEAAPQQPDGLMPAARIPPRENPEVTAQDLAAPPMENTSFMASVPTVASAVHPTERMKEALAAPDIKLVMRTEAGMELPIIGADGTKPSEYFARPFTREGSTPVISVALTGLGYNKTVSESAVNLPGEFTLVFSPYAPGTPNWVKSARQFGHETWVELPMETADYPASDPGPHGIYADMQGPAVGERINWVISRFQGLVGVFTPYDEIVTTAPAAFRPVLEELSKRGLLLVATNPSASPERDELLTGFKGVATKATVVIEQGVPAEVIREKLKEAEELAKQTGSVLISARAYPVLLKELSNWQPTLSSKNIQLAPVSAAVDLAS